MIINFGTLFAIPSITRRQIQRQICPGTTALFHRDYWQQLGSDDLRWRPGRENSPLPISIKRREEEKRHDDRWKNRNQFGGPYEYHIFIFLLGGAVLVPPGMIGAKQPSAFQGNSQSALWDFFFWVPLGLAGKQISVNGGMVMEPRLFFLCWKKRTIYGLKLFKKASVAPAVSAFVLRGQDE